MIEQAGARGVYDRLAVADLDAVLAEEGVLYDLVLAADTLVYIGDLGPAFRGARRRLKPGGFLLFTVERGMEPGYALGPKRRYRHGEGYLRGEAEQSGLEIDGAVALHAARGRETRRWKAWPWPCSARAA